MGRLRSYSWALADATLSNGAAIQSAGGGLPMRVATAPIVTFGTPLATGGALGDSKGQMDVRADGADGVVAGAYDGQKLVRFDANGGVLWTKTFQALKLGVDAALGEVYVGSYPGQTINIYRLSDGALLRSWTAAGLGSSTGIGGIKVVATDRIWIAPWVGGGSALSVEFDRNGVATGRTVTAHPGAQLEGFTATLTHVYFAEQTTPFRWRRRISDNVLETFGTAERADLRLGHYWMEQSRAVAVGTGEVYFLNQTGSYIDAYDETTRAAIKRVGWGGFRSGQIDGIHSGSSVAHGMDDLGEFLVVRAGPYGLLRLDKRTQRAQWSRLFSSAATLKFILLPGSLGNERDASFDDRKTRAYYSLNGVDFTEFTPGAPLSVAITAGQTLTVRADMTTWAKPTGTPPWIGGDAGEGPTVLYEEPEAADVTVSVSSPAAIAVAITTPPAINVEVS